MTSIQGRSEGRANNTNYKSVDFPTLTGNQQMIYSALLGLGRAAKAYELLDILRDKGVKAAPTVYRALHELEEKDLVQHIVSSRAFVALKEPDKRTKEKITLLCDTCGETRFVENEPLLAALSANASNNGFSVRSYHLEIETSCDGCDRRCTS
ncbi:Fur family transcriptional regulator [Kordiimonas aquimaris]|uniref:Fur family transcriptional regulator n=1 Tax=Kordiimonas aquimaris TaxID=707591 RepID=UPI0021CF48B6|nr:transcriptional repressor [Kordiimonas aquimaris]